MPNCWKSHVAAHLSLRSLFCHFLSGNFTQVLLYVVLVALNKYTFFDDKALMCPLFQIYGGGHFKVNSGIFFKVHHLFAVYSGGKVDLDGAGYLPNVNLPISGTGYGKCLILYTCILGGIAQSVMCLATDASLTADPGVASSIPARSHTFVEIYHEIISSLRLNR